MFLAIIVAIIGFLVVLNNLLKIPVINILSSYKEWMIAIGLIIGCGISILFFTNKSGKS